MACCRRLERLYRRISRPSRVGRALPPPQQHQGLIVSLGQAVGELADGAGDLVQQLMDRPVALAAKELDQAAHPELLLGRRLRFGDAVAVEADEIARLQCKGARLVARLGKEPQRQTARPE